MAGIARTIAALVVAAICIALLVIYASGLAAEAQPGQAQRTQEVHRETCVLVEAFVVEVKLSSLYEQAVSPLGQRPNSVSVKNLLDCLNNKDAGQVTAGVKVSLRSTANAKTRTTETIYTERQVSLPAGRRTDGPAVSRSYRNYDIGNQFDAGASIGSNGAILVDFEFSQSTCRNVSSSEEAPPNTVNRQWSGTASLNAGEPAIVGATQNEETAAFLVLCAHHVGDR
ncbi:MAG TPA: hypothetical protein VMW24_28290 [Sedimentisphaerales bacterium]|nr:hypothetical protein [Sedimentisphaerales bacterium]